VRDIGVARGKCRCCRATCATITAAVAMRRPHSTPAANAAEPSRAGRERPGNYCNICQSVCFFFQNSGPIIAEYKKLAFFPQILLCSAELLQLTELQFNLELRTVSDFTDGTTPLWQGFKQAGFGAVFKPCIIGNM